MHFIIIGNRIDNHIENIRCNPKIETRNKCDASRCVYGAALEQLTANGWKPVSFVSKIS